ncbi:MAG: alpha-L-fucosidase [bacterium]|nr:alpha-L-fucosidase [bacterium]
MSVVHCALLMMAASPGAASPPAPVLPVPTPQQLAWQNMEYGMFCHFGINTFYDQEWGDGTEDPARFNPTELDALQWATVAKETGMGYLVFTAKHHDGFCLFPSALTDHSLEASPWRDGKGDVVKEAADACREAGIMFGFYLSPWDRHEPKYADSAGYDEYFRAQLRELLTNYGTVGEVWFDGAGSEGHVYDWQSYYDLIYELQPGALVAVCGPDIRWVGNENGLAPRTLWNVQERDGKPVWWPSECDVPIRRGHWFFATNSENTVRTVEQIVNIYYMSVGRGAGLLLNVTPDRRGLLPEKDVSVLREAWRIISETFKTNLAEGKPATASAVRGDGDAFAAGNVVDGSPDTYWATDDDVTTGHVVIDLGAPTTFNRAMAAEYLQLGQRVEEYAIEVRDGLKWREVVKGTTIGHKRLDKFDDVTARKVRLVIKKAKACPTISAFGVYQAVE